jgi:hypothetical protein
VGHTWAQINTLALATRSSPGSGLSSGRMARIAKLKALAAARKALAAEKE